MSAREALEIATIGGAKVLGRDDIGSLATGMCADLFALNLSRLDYAGAAVHDPVASVIFCAPQKADYVMVNGKWVVMRVPYPLGYFAKGMDGRIDDRNAGWKGKGLWSAFSNLAPTHIEGGKGQTSKVVHFQIRPNPISG